MQKRNQARIVIITGANSGIGKAAAIKFASEGWQVIMACRSLERSRAAQAEIISATGNGSVALMQLDISSFASIRQFCAQFKEQHDRLDVLVHNAGYFNYGAEGYQFSPDGLELTFATNVFGPMLMTELLIEELARSNDPRVLFAASTNLKHFFDPKRAIEFDNLRGELAGKRPYTVYKMYGDSKMGTLLLARRMADAYKEKGIKVNAVMIPQVKIATGALDKMKGIYRVIGTVIQNWNPNALTPEQMAGCYYDICAAEGFKEVTGVLVDAKRRVLQPAGAERLNPFAVIGELVNTRHSPPYASNPANVEQMWRLSKDVIAGAIA